jgi:hypothetical protein
MKRIHKVVSEFILSCRIIMHVTKFERFTLYGVMLHAFILILLRNFVLTSSVVTHVYL